MASAASVAVKPYRAHSSITRCTGTAAPASCPSPPRPGRRRKSTITSRGLSRGVRVAGGVAAPPVRAGAGGPTGLPAAARPDGIGWAPPPVSARLSPRSS
eukprot:13119670-Alexandrium_andersonii.AAC.1